MLNAKQHEREADIIAQAGSEGTITIATGNMAGRGTDIVLGGNIDKQLKAIEQRALSETERQQQIQQLRADWQAAHDKIVALGGLRIIATERRESRRIDNQLRGRSGCQGDPGSSRFLSEPGRPADAHLRGRPSQAIIMDRLKMPEGEAIEAGIVTRSIEGRRSAKVETQLRHAQSNCSNMTTRPTTSAKVIYQQRNDILDSQTRKWHAGRDARGRDHRPVVRRYVPAESMEEQWGCATAWRRRWPANGRIDLSLPLQDVAGSESITDEDILEKVVKGGPRSVRRLRP